MKRLIFTTAILASTMLGFEMAYAQTANPYATGITVLPNQPAIGQQFDVVVSIGNNDDADGPIPENAVLWTINVPLSVEFTYTVGSQIPGTPFYVHQLSNGTNSKILILRNNIVLPASTINNTSQRKFIISLPAVSNVGIVASAPNISINAATAIGQASIGNNSPGDDNATGTLQVTAPVPIQLLSFSGKANSCEVHLSWDVVLEENFKGYDLEVSENGKEFTKVAFIQGGKRHYTYNHAQKAPTSYYRLKIIDNDGSFSMSEVVRVILDCERDQPDVYPNPAQDLLFVDGVSVGTSMVISNIAGVVLRSYNAHGGINKIQIQDLVSGQYLITLHNKGEKSTTIKFVKN